LTLVLTVILTLPALNVTAMAGRQESCDLGEAVI